MSIEPRADSVPARPRRDKNHPTSEPPGWTVRSVLEAGKRVLVLGVSVAMMLAIAVLPVPAATADTAPVDPANPATPLTVSADALPTVQIDGVAWQQLVVGNTVYVVGNFTTARPAGSAPGSNTVTRNNILAYDITTGKLNTTFVASLNAQAKAITVSPDGSRIYVAGAFTAVNGVSRPYVAALNPTTGALITSFAPNVNSRVYALAATNTSVFMGGWFSGVGSVSRPHLAAVRASDAALLSWNPVVAGGDVNNMVISPDSTKVVVGGNFTSINGSSNPGYGMAALDTSSGALLPWAVNGLVRNGGTQASIFSLTSDGTNVYGTGYVYGSGGNLEGAFSASWDGGKLNWVEDCHGDSYGVYASDTAVYTVSHDHYCGNIDGFPQTSPKWTFHHALAFSKATTGTITDDPYGYYNYAGTPRPSLLPWFPDLDVGSFTGQSQAAWTINGNSQYVILGGEFPTVNGTAQQGLVRFATKNIAPNKQGPVLTGSAMNPTVLSLAAGTVRVAWQANWDKDNENLKYDVIRDDHQTTPIFTTTKASTFWKRAAMGFQDTGLVPGSTHSYRIFVTDPFGNIARSDGVTVTVASAGNMSAYANDVLADGAGSYWRLGEGSGSSLVDWAGWSDAVAGTGVTRGTPGAIAGDTNTATTFDGTVNGSAATQTAIPGPDVFSAETWINTTTTSGGKILGFGNNPTGNSNNYDRHIYMDNAGHIYFGVYTGSTDTLRTAGTYNDGQWHQIAASLGANGMVLYVDGKRVGQRGDVIQGQPYSGYWRIGGDSISSWPGGPSSDYFRGAIDEVSIYPSIISLQQVQKHFTDSGRTLNIPVAPADNYGKAVFQAAPDLYWRLGESSGTTAADSSASDNPGTYVDGVTLGGPSGIAGTTNTSASFNGTSGLLSSANVFSNPTTYSEELWFNTTTQQGGKLIGFGDQPTGLSNGYDRHVYMETNGALTFGVWTGQTNTITSPQSYNDGKWHHMVATQSSGGMKLYVDGTVVGTNPQTQAQVYSGYWRVGSDRTWGPQPYFAGAIDEVAIYPVALSDADVANHFALGSAGQVANQSPVAAFTSSSANLVASFDGSGSSDPDGTVASYGWDFGDGTAAGSGVSPSHTYAAAGTFQVKLTVTDNQGGTGSVTKPVTVTALPLAQDGFARIVANGFGKADVGGNWTVSGGNANFAVNNGSGKMITAKGVQLSAILGSLSSTSSDTQVKLALDKLSDGGGFFTTVIGRRVSGAGDYLAKIWISKSGAMTLDLKSTAGGTETTFKSITVPGLTYTAGMQLQVRLQVSGTSPTVVRAKVWNTAAAEPSDWQVTATDSAGAMQSAGSVGVMTYLSGSATNGPVTLSLKDWVTRRAD